MSKLKAFHNKKSETITEIIYLSIDYSLLQVAAPFTFCSLTQVIRKHVIIWFC